MADFPSSVKTFPTLVDLVDDVLAAHQNERGDEITAIEEYLIDLTTPYRIAVSVTSNNLTLALKDRDGNDPSATSPVRVQIGDTVRTVASALSVTKNAGTNWCNSGSSELATKEIDYFAYLGYNATDGVVIGFSRIPFARIYSNFSATTTNEKYAAISTITNAASSDAYTVIGRFAATLSAGAGYTWSVPTFTAKDLLHQPIHETRMLEWTPAHSRSGGAYSNAPSNTRSAYQIISNRLHYAQQHTQHGTPGSSGYQIVSLPFTAAVNFSGTGFNLSDGYALAVFTTSLQLRLFKFDGTGEAVASKAYGAWGNYEI